MEFNGDEQYVVEKKGRWFVVQCVNETDPEIKAANPVELIRKMGKNEEILNAYHAGNIDFLETIDPEIQLEIKTELTALISNESVFYEFLDYN